MIISEQILIFFLWYLSWFLSIIYFFDSRVLICLFFFICDKYHLRSPWGKLCGWIVVSILHRCPTVSLFLSHSHTIFHKPAGEEQDYSSLYNRGLVVEFFYGDIALTQFINNFILHSLSFFKEDLRFLE